MLNVINTLYDLIVTGKQKAIAAFVVGVVSTYVVKYGFDIETLTVKEAIEQLVYGVIAYAGTYIPTNK